VTPLPRLTLRKVSILLHLDAGRGIKQIAGALDVHPNTVKQQIRQIASTLPGKPGASHRDTVLRYLDRLLEHNADIASRV
jgi:DNA-binding NarL/FixJ family response regulator